MTGWETLLTGLTTPELAGLNAAALIEVGRGVMCHEDTYRSEALSYFQWANVLYDSIDEHDRDRLVAAVALYEIETRLSDMSPVNRAAVVAAGIAVIQPGVGCGRA